jgi:hypothetical protein
MLSVRSLIHKLFGKRGSLMPIGEVELVNAQEVDWSSLRVGDHLMATDDVPLQTHRRGRWYAASYPNNRQFVSGKAYSIVQVRRRTGVVFVFDEGGFRVALNEFQGRRFAIKRSASAIH